jgi:hypothetical protein
LVPGTKYKIPLLDYFLLWPILAGLVYDNLRVALASSVSDEWTLENMGCAAYYWHEIVAPFHYLVALTLALRVGDGFYPLKKEWLRTWLLGGVGIATAGLSAYGAWHTYADVCPGISLESAPGDAVVAENPDVGFDAAIAHLFLGCVLYILVGACLWVRARHLTFLILQSLLLPLLAGVAAGGNYAWWTGNLWECIWAFSFVLVEFWLTRQERDSWTVLEKMKEEKGIKGAVGSNSVAAEEAGDIKVVEDGRVIAVAGDEGV